MLVDVTSWTYIDNREDSNLIISGVENPQVAEIGRPPACDVAVKLLGD
jgi:hypothetical protein